MALLVSVTETERFSRDLFGHGEGWIAFCDIDGVEEREHVWTCFEGRWCRIQMDGEKPPTSQYISVYVCVFLIMIQYIVFRNIDIF